MQFYYKKDSDTSVFSVTFAKFLRTTILKDICERLLLYLIKQLYKTDKIKIQSDIYNWLVVLPCPSILPNSKKISIFLFFGSLALKLFFPTFQNEMLEIAFLILEVVPAVIFVSLSVHCKIFFRRSEICPNQVFSFFGSRFGFLS